MEETRTDPSRKAADESKGNWIDVAALDDLAENALVEVLVGRTLVLLIRRENRILAVQGLCPHNFAPFAGGRIAGDGTLVCPVHGARFDLTTGHCVANWVLPALKRYPVRIENGRVLLPDPLRALPEA